MILTHTHLSILFFSFDAITYATRLRAENNDDNNDDVDSFGASGNRNNELDKQHWSL